MARYTAEIVVDAGKKAAFDYLSHFSSVSKWDPSAVESKDLTEPPVAKGSRFLVVSKFLGKKLPLEYEIIEFSSPDKVILRAEDSKIVSTDTITFEGTDSGTKVRYDAQLDLKSGSKVADIVVNLVFQVLGFRAAKGIKRELARLQPAPFDPGKE